MNNLVIYAGAFKNGSTIGVKNVTIYKSPQWTSCVILKNNIALKCINRETLSPDIPYQIEVEKYQGLPSLLCDNMIIYQQERWFEYKLDFSLNEEGFGEKFFEYNVKGC